MSSDKIKNHYVQKARLKHFSIKDGHSQKTYLIDMDDHSSKLVDVSEVFEMEHLYHPELEDRLGKMEAKSSEILNRFLQGNDWTIERSEFDRILRYVLLQWYRTPSTFKDIMSSLDTDPLHIVRDDLRMLGLDEDEDGLRSLFISYIEEILDNQWSSLRNSRFLRIRNSVRTLDRFWPFVVRTDGPLILNDRGLAMEIIGDFEVDWDGVKNGMREVYGKEFTPTEVEGDITIRKWINLFCLPLEPHRALVLAEDIWRASLMNPGAKQILNEHGFHSDFIERNGIIPLFCFKDSSLNSRIRQAGLDTFIDSFSNEDQITVMSIQTDNFDSEYLNTLSWVCKSGQCACQDIQELLDSINKAKEDIRYKNQK